MHMFRGLATFGAVVVMGSVGVGCSWFTEFGQDAAFDPDLDCPLAAQSGGDAHMDPMVPGGMGTNAEQVARRVLGRAITTEALRVVEREGGALVAIVRNGDVIGQLHLSQDPGGGGFHMSGFAVCENQIDFPPGEGGA